MFDQLGGAFAVVTPRLVACFPEAVKQQSKMRKMAKIPATSASRAVAFSTQASGPTGWFGAGRGSRRLLGTLLASLAVHAFLTPFPALFGLIAMLPALHIADDVEMIEVELTTLPVASVAPSPLRPAQPLEPPKAEVPPPSTSPPVKEAPEEPAEAKAEPQEEPPKPPDPPPATEEVAPNELYADPIALAGKAADVTDPNANVRLFIFADVIRNQPLGERVGSLLKRTPQWNDFFGTADIDPIRDVDRVLIAGPQLRNSSQVVAVVQHHLKPAQIDAAFELLVARKGEWIDKEARLARAQADRAARIFAAPNDSVVVVAPPQMEGQLRRLGEQSKFARGEGDIALSAYLVTPHRVAKGTGLKLPKSVKWARLDLRPTPDGGGVLKLLAQDEDEASARKNSEFFQMLIDQVASVDLKRGGGLGALASMLLGSQKVRLLKEASFRAQGDRIEGTIVATRDQLLNLMDLLEAFLPPPSSSASSDKSANSTAPAEAPAASGGTSAQDSAADVAPTAPVESAPAEQEGAP